MISKKTKKFSSFILAIVLGTTTLAGCGGTTSSKNVKQSIVMNLGADPKTIDPALNDAIDGATVIANAFEGLSILDQKDNPTQGIASSWDISSDGLTYTFHLRDAKWSDGQPVKASDFEYAWKRVLNPDTASDYAYYLFYLKNGEAYNSSKDPKYTGPKATADDVGVKAVDDKTLRVTLEEPCPYFLSLTAFPTYAPVRKDVVEKAPSNWWQNPDTYICNGPFKMTYYKSKDKIQFVKNNNFWDAKSIKLNNLEYRVLDEAATYMSSFTNKEIDIIYQPPTTQIPSLVKAGTAKIYPQLGTYYVEFNLTSNAAKVDPAAAKAISDPRVREALCLALNRQTLVDKVTKGGETAAYAFVPKGIPDASTGKDFAAKEYFPPKGDIARAKKLLSDAGYPDGKGFPTLTYLYNTAQNHQDIAVFIQDAWKTNLGINITLKNEEWAVFQKDRTSKNYIVARAGWVADFTDPMTFLDVFNSKGGNNDPGYANANYDKKLSDSKKETDKSRRMKTLHDAEDILMADYPIIPLYYYTNVVCIQSGVKSVHVSPLGFFMFRWAYRQ